MVWEYMTVRIGAGGFLGGWDAEALTARLNELGSEGWELVSMFDTNMGGRTRDVIAILKRGSVR